MASRQHVGNVLIEESQPVIARLQRPVAHFKGTCEEGRPPSSVVWAFDFVVPAAAFELAEGGRHVKVVREGRYAISVHLLPMAGTRCFPILTTSAGSYPFYSSAGEYGNTVLSITMALPANAVVYLGEHYTGGHLFQTHHHLSIQLV